MWRSLPHLGVSGIMRCNLLNSSTAAATTIATVAATTAASGVHTHAPYCNDALLQYGIDQGRARVGLDWKVVAGGESAVALRITGMGA
jgi:hypothetical protein